ncbi:MAG: energy-coupling factor transporter transmembrane protein EcfT [Chloroflexia bacterium]|nr:energy-coupling factor transporter transmembrane protein EcfT [Chloroflexia bacterium]MDQ3411315.1 energy-coupling factor transporter transmembrane protein EcfT [Chloroflexota bacterium]
MSVAFAVYEPGQSWLHRLDPRVKLLGVGLGMVAAILANSLWPLAVSLVTAHALILSAGVPVRRIGHLWRAIVPFLILILILWPVFDRAGTRVVLDFGWFRLTVEAINRGLVAACRLATISFLVAVWLRTTSEQQLIQSFVRLGLPYRWGVALAIGLRSIPLLAGVYTGVAEAQQARGLRLDGPVHHRLRAQIPILVATLVTVIRMAEQTARALDARGFGGPARPTTLHRLRFRPADWVALALLLGTAIVGAIAWFR